MTVHAPGSPQARREKLVARLVARLVMMLLKGPQAGLCQSLFPCASGLSRSSSTSSSGIRMQPRRENSPERLRAVGEAEVAAATARIVAVAAMVKDRAEVEARPAPPLTLLRPCRRPRRHRL